MKEFIKRINWKKFGKYELICFGICIALYLNSNNKFPQNFYAVILIPILFALMLIVNAHSHYIIEKSKNGNNRN